MSAGECECKCSVGRAPARQKRVAVGVGRASAAHTAQRASAEPPERRHNAQVFGGAAVAPQVLRDHVVRVAHREHVGVCGGTQRDTRSVQFSSGVGTKRDATRLKGCVLSIE